jgi:hypothetical protein
MNQTLRMRTEKRIKSLKEMMPGFKIIKIWEHQFDLLIKDNPDVADFVKKILSKLL